MRADRALAERLVRLAGGIALELRGGPAGTKLGATDVVTEADRRAEAALVEVLRAERPDDAITGEEGAAVGAAGGRRWLLDPVDGTLNYAAGLPTWCAAVALVDEHGGLASAVYDPTHDELYSAARGAGATAGGRPLALGGAPPLADAVVATFVGVRRRDAEIDAATRVLVGRIGELRAFGCGSLELAAVAAGRVHGWVQADVAEWDWHPGALLVAEAGGTVLARGRWRAAAASAELAAALLP
jgi:myo-inositol-1(or 4)-monophosphatase